MNSQHLSDEAIAAFADDVLSGHARDRASRHALSCPECAHAVAVQREAVWALRAAPAPPLPSGLLDRLRSVPTTTPLNVAPTTIGPDGSAMFAAFGTMTSAALVPPESADARHRRVRPLLIAAVAVATVGFVAVSSTGQTSEQKWKPVKFGPGSAVPAGFVDRGGVAPAIHNGH